jgi:uncharacterized ParB-like nuclease family protein
VSGQPVELRLDQLLFLRNCPAGMDWAVIGRFVCELRKGAAPVDPPIRVYREDGTTFYRVADGRHRTVASMMAGRDVILAVIEPKAV